MNMSGSREAWLPHKTPDILSGGSFELYELVVWGPSGPRLLFCGPSGLLDFVLCVGLWIV